MEDMKVRLSTLWIFVMFNMVFADIVGLLNPGALEEMIAMKPSQGVLLAFSMLLEIPIAMIVLSRILRHKANRLVNMIAGVTTICFVIGGGNTSASYLFFLRLSKLLVWSQLSCVRGNGLKTDEEIRHACPLVICNTDFWLCVIAECNDGSGRQATR